MEREAKISEVARPTASKRQLKRYKTIMEGLKRKEEVKKEFQDYLNHSCDVWKRKEKDDN